VTGWRVKIVPVDFSLYRLIDRFTHDFAQTAPPDQEALALAYIRRAHDLGKVEKHGKQELPESGEHDLPAVLKTMLRGRG
jgi:hypothetical protein